jgi:hypothetical protein
MCNIIFYRSVLQNRQQIISDASKVKQFRNTVGDHKSEYTRQKKREIEIKKKMAAFKEVSTD